MWYIANDMYKSECFCSLQKTYMRTFDSRDWAEKRGRERKSGFKGDERWRWGRKWLQENVNSKRGKRWAGRRWRAEYVKANVKWRGYIWALDSSDSIAGKDQENWICDGPEKGQCVWKKDKKGFQGKKNNEKKNGSIYLLSPNSGHPLSCH